MRVWEEAHCFVLAIYRETAAFPGVERFRLTDQILRSVTSVAANIAEGKSRRTRADFRHFLVTARASLEETRYFLLLAKDLGYLSETAHLKHDTRAEKIHKMLNALVGHLVGKS
ncbi:MAG: four helix bundle protein [Opitutaceae bacterium]|nr:four helix bundle protein [Opitutaceae bacterium]